MNLSDFSSFPDFPVREVLPALEVSLDVNPNLVLIAPPGAGKTTLVPLALLNCKWRQGRKIVVLEPRRLAARAAARRMAQLLEEEIGKRVGYRVRFDTRISGDTVVEVVTEGVFSRMLAEDPGLEGVAAVLFDEFHERSLDGDLALALCLDLQSGLREDLRLIAMSATLDGAQVSEIMEAEKLESSGRSYPVELEYRDRSPDLPIEDAVVNAVRDELARHGKGSILVFLPGQREIERVFNKLDDKTPADVSVHRLYGAVNSKLQDEALRPPAKDCRKVVLASAIAETSLTIEGITTVIDSGLSRQAVYEPATGLTRLQTVRASQASVIQRAGRAGRLGPGRAVRLWREAQTAALPPFTPPEIVNADLSSLVLDLADWGVADVGQLKWIDRPPEASLAEAAALLKRLDALDGDGRITAHGKTIHTIALPPRMAHMVVKAGAISRQAAEKAALLALLVQERGAGGRAVDLDERCGNVAKARDGRSKKLVQLARSIASNTGQTLSEESAESGVLLGFAFPDRIAQNQGPTANGTARFRLANGRGAEIDAGEPLSREAYLVVVDMAGRAGASRILSAAAISKVDLTNHFSSHIEVAQDTSFDPGSGRFETLRSTRLGNIVLDKPVAVKVDSKALEAALLQAVRDHGLDLLPWQESDRQLRARLQMLHCNLGMPWPDLSSPHLLERLDEWLSPFLGGVSSLQKLKPGTLGNGLLLLASHPANATFEQLVPSRFKAPSGSTIPLDYQVDEEAQCRVVLHARPQELFGLDVHPTVVNDTVLIDIELLSPASRAIQITRDLPGFWRGSWRDVRSDMRGRYPKHPWPEDPLTAMPTARVKARKK